MTQTIVITKPVANFATPAAATDPISLTGNGTIQVKATVKDNNGNAVPNAVVNYRQSDSLPALILAGQTNPINVPANRIRQLKANGVGELIFSIYSTKNVIFSATLEIPGQQDSQPPAEKFPRLMAFTSNVIAADQGLDFDAVSSEEADGTVHIPTGSEEATFRLPRQCWAYFSRAQDAHAALLVNNGTANTVVISPLKEAVFDGISVLATNLNTKGDKNTISYMLYNGGESVTSFSAQLAVTLTGDEKPIDGGPLRILENATPYLAGYAGGIGSIGTDNVDVFINLNDVDTKYLVATNYIAATVYIDGWYHGTLRPHRDIIPKTVTPFTAGQDFTKPVTFALLNSELQGYGLQQGTDEEGEIYIDYSIIDGDTGDTLAKPVEYFDGQINTVSPFI
jgi:hypothetical protein